MQEERGEEKRRRGVGRRSGEWEKVQRRGEEGAREEMRRYRGGKRGEEGRVVNITLVLHRSLDLARPL